MKLRLFTVFVFLATFAVLRGALPSDESIAQMMSVMHAEKMLDQMLAQMNSSMEQGFNQSLHGRELTAGVVDVGKHARPNLRDGCAVLFVVRNEMKTLSATDWMACKLK